MQYLFHLASYVGHTVRLFLGLENHVVPCFCLFFLWVMFCIEFVCLFGGFMLGSEFVCFCVPYVGNWVCLFVFWVNYVGHCVCLIFV